MQALVVRTVKDADRARVEDRALGQLQLVAQGVVALDQFDHDDLMKAVSRIRRKIEGSSSMRWTFGPRPRSEALTASSEIELPRSEMPTVSSEIGEAAVVSETNDSARPRSEMPTDSSEVEPIAVSSGMDLTEGQRGEQVRSLQLRAISTSRFIQELVDEIIRARPDRGYRDFENELAFEIVRTRFLPTHLDFISERLARSLMSETVARAFLDRAEQDIATLERIVSITRVRDLAAVYSQIRRRLAEALPRADDKTGMRLKDIAQGMSAGLDRIGLPAFKVLLMEGFVEAERLLAPYPRVPMRPIMDPNVSATIAEAIVLSVSVARIFGDALARGKAAIEDGAAAAETFQETLSIALEHVDRRRAQLEALEENPVDIAYARDFSCEALRDLKRTGSIANGPARASILLSLLYRIGTDVDNISNVERRKEYSAAFQQLDKQAVSAFKDDKSEEARFVVMRAHVMISAAIWPYGEVNEPEPPDTPPASGGGGGATDPADGRSSAFFAGAVQSASIAHANIPESYMLSTAKTPLSMSAAGALCCFAFPPVL